MINLQEALGLERRPVWLWLLLITGFAAGLRLINIGIPSLWFDEAVSYLAAAEPVTKILENTVQSSHPPLYYLFLHVWQLWAPDSDLAMRLPSLFWDLLLIPATYLLADALFERRQLALGAASLVAVSPFHILYSHELRMYTQLMFFVTAGTWAYWRAVKSNRWSWWLLFTLMFLAAMYTHLFTAFLLLAIAAHALLYHRHDRRVFIRTFCFSRLIVLLFGPWLLTILLESQRDMGSMRPLFNDQIENPIIPLTSPTFLLFGVSASLVYGALAMFITLAGGLFLLFEARKIWREGIPPGLVLLILIQLGVIGIPVMIYLIRPFFLPERSMAAASPFLIILLVWSGTRRGTPLPYLVGIAAVLMLVGSFTYLTRESVKPPFREAMQFIEQRLEATDVVLHTSDSSYFPAMRYVDISRHAVLDGDPNPRKSPAVYRNMGGEVWTLSQAVASGDRLWLVVTLDHSREWQRDQVSTLSGRYAELETHHFGGIAVILYRVSQE